MSAFKGKTVKNKSKLRKEVKDIQEFNKRAIEQEGSPLQQLINISQKMTINSTEKPEDILNKQVGGLIQVEVGKEILDYPISKKELNELNK